MSSIRKRSKRGFPSDRDVQLWSTDMRRARLMRSLPFLGGKFETGWQAIQMPEIDRDAEWCAAHGWTLLGYEHDGARIFEAGGRKFTVPAIR